MAISKTISTSCNLFSLSFIGHGSGDTYLNMDYLNRLLDLQNRVLLMGCSSASLFPIAAHKKIKHLEFDGILADYLSSDS